MVAIDRKASAALLVMTCRAQFGLGYSQPMHLPPELHRPIIQNIERIVDLYRLLFVSRTVFSETERVLYHTIRRTGAYPTRSIQLYLHLARCWRVARYVQELEVSGGMDSQVMEALKHALSALGNLRILSLSNVYMQPGSLYNPRNPPPTIIKACAFKLEVIRLRGDTTKGLPFIDLTQVKELFMASDRDDSIIEFAPDAFRTLRVLSCNSSQFLKFGSRNTEQIKALELFSHPRSPLWTDKTFRNVTSLKVYPTHGMMRSFPSLRFLCLQVEDNACIKSEMALSDVVGELTALTSLEKLSLVTFAYMYQYPDDLGEMFFSRLGSLEELIVSPPVRDVVATRWDRKGRIETITILDDVGDEWRSPRWF